MHLHIPSDSLSRLYQCSVVTGNSGDELRMLSMDVHNIKDLGKRIHNVVGVLHMKCVVVVVDNADGTSCSQQRIEIHTLKVSVVQIK